MSSSAGRFRDTYLSIAILIINVLAFVMLTILSSTAIPVSIAMLATIIVK